MNLVHLVKKKEPIYNHKNLWKCPSNPSHQAKRQQANPTGLEEACNY
jgi:hypothetical protein